MTITQCPDELSFSGNIKDLVLTGISGSLPFTLVRAGETVVSETYAAAPDGTLAIVLRDVLENHVPCPPCAAGDAEIAQYSYTIGTVTESFRCIRGGHGANAPAAVFCKANFLTWQPQTRYTLYHTPQYLRYVALEAAMCKVCAYFKDGSTQTVDYVAAMAANRIHTLDVSFGAVRGQLEQQPTYYDVWVECGDAKTWPQRYILAAALPGVEDIFLFENSLGGFDSIRFSGDRKEVCDIESLYALFGDQTLEYDVDGTRSWQKFTGYIENENERIWTLDFFNSHNRYHLVDGVLHRIYVSKPKLEATVGEVAGYEFTFARSGQSKYLSLPRVEIPELLEIVSPEDEIFFLRPRLNEFEWTDLIDDVIIPVQRLHSNKWFSLPGILIRQLTDKAEAAIEGLAEIFHPKGGRVTLDMKARDLTAVGTTSVKDIVVDGVSRTKDFASGVTGVGWQVDASGDAELESLMLRRFLEVPELRYNRVDVTVGDRWRAAGGGIVESVDQEAMTLKLKLEPGELGAVKAGDICMGIWHDGSPELNASQDGDDGAGNRTFAGFRTVYFTIEEVFDGGTCRYSLRPTSDKYPRQGQPAAMMRFVAYGSFTDPARRTSVYETRTYSRHLQGVDDWEFTAANIVAQWGDLSNLNILGVDMTGYSAYLDRIYLRGTIHQIDGEGDPIPAGRWESSKVPYVKNSVVDFAGYQFRALRDTSAAPVGLLKSGEYYLTSGGGYILRGAAEDFVSDDWTIYVPPGLPGLISRQSEWAPGVEYRNDENRPTRPGLLDTVTVGTGNAQRFFVCIRTHRSSDTITTDNPLYWREANDMGPIYASNIFAPNASIEFLNGQRIVVRDPQGNIVAGLSAAGDIPLWVGDDPTVAPLRYDYVLKQLTVEGIIRALSGTIAGFEIANGRIGKNASVTSPGTLSGMTLTESFLRFAADGVIAMLGSNTLPPSAGGTTIALNLAVDKAQSATAPQSNIAVRLSASGCPETYTDMGRNDALLIEEGNFVHRTGTTIRVPASQAVRGTIITRGRTMIKLVSVSSPGSLALQAGYDGQIIHIVNTSGGTRTLTGTATGNQNIDNGRHMTLIYSSGIGWCPSMT